MRDLGGALGLAAAGGQAALVVSLVLVLVCAASVWARARRVRRKARLLAVRARAEQEVVLEGARLLLARGVEMERLLEPWRRLLFWARHPLTRALWGQYFRR
ncbi:MAG: hypothetical protein ACREQM_20415 [Candidatus Dormibacteraceae bacterium]